MPALDLLVIDEAHHAVADSYRRSSTGAAPQPDVPHLRGHGHAEPRRQAKGLREVFSNVADQIRLGELIASGHLVPPRTFVIDVGVQEDLRNVRRTATTSTWPRSPPSWTRPRSPRR
jgi:DNA repair protein RadD